MEDFAILDFPPREVGRSTWRYATNGMSSYLQSHPDKNIRVRTEVFASTLREVSWVCELLAAIATYPADYATYLADGDTIDVGQPIDRSASPFTGVFLTAPGPFDAPTLGLIGGLPDKVLVHQVVGLFPAELLYASREGSAGLPTRLWQHGEPLLDELRDAVY